MKKEHDLILGKRPKTRSKKSKEDKKTYECEDCCKVFKQKSHLDDHKKAKHTV